VEKKQRDGFWGRMSRKQVKDLMTRLTSQEFAAGEDRRQTNQDKRLGWCKLGSRGHR
jgi:hypothetical protein